MKKTILLLAFSVVVIAWITLIPVEIGNSYVPVHAVKASFTTVVNTISCSGSLEVGKKYQVLSGYSLKIRKALFQVGNTVKKGEKLFDLDQTMTAQLLSNSNTAVSNQTAIAPILTENQKEAIQQALNTGVISKNTYQKLLTQISHNYNADSGSITVSKGETDTKKILKTIIGQIQAPAAGVLSAIDDGTNGVSKAGNLLAEIIDFHSIEAKIQVDESNLKYLKAGQRVKITGPGFYGSYWGTVGTIYPVAKSTASASGTQNIVDVLVRIDKPDKKLLPGLSVNANVQISKKQNIVKLPYDAVLQDDDGTEYVFVIRNGKAVRQNILTGNEDADAIEVTKGLHSGELVINNANNSAINGANVKLE